MGSSKKVTVGYKYYLGMHLILCHGPADSLRRITVDGRIAWIGVNEGGRVNVANEGLFGGEQREGGVSGACDLEMGRPDQGRNDYLIGQLGADLPAFRGVVGFVMRQAYLGLNPYLKRWGFRLQRIHVRQNGLPQWYDEKAEISTLVPTILDEPWQYQVLPYHSNPGYDNIAIPTSGWQGEAVLPFTDSNVWLYPTPPGWPTVDRSVVWIKKTVHNVPAGLVIQARADNGCLLWVNGTYIGASNRDNAPIPSNNNYPVEFTVPASGTYEVVVKAYTEDSTGDQAGNYLSITLADVPNGGDMNPAHIIRECLTDPDWGMGYQDADVDDDAFMAAADKLYTEGMGMSLLWDRQMPIEDFVMEVVKHINASVYVDRSTGKFVLKLIRDDYDKDDLLVIDEDNISKVENATRPTTGELVNSISVVYWDAQTGENASVTVQDQALIQMQGSVVNTTLQFPGFTNATIASKVALRSLRSLSTPLLSCTVYADRTASKLNVGDVFRLTWPDLEIDDLVMRVAALAFGDGKSNTVKITCIEDSFAFPETATVVPDIPGWENPSQPATPSPHRLPFESPYYELVQTLGQSDVDGMLLESPDAALLMAAASAPPGGIQAVVSANAGAGFEDVAALDFCPYATLQTDMDALTTEVTFSDGVDLDLVAVGTIVRIGEEECRVDAIDVGTSTLTVGRGCLDTPPIPHSVGEGIFFWDVYNAVDQTEYVLGETVQVKILPTTGGGALDPGAAPTDSVTFEGRPIRPYPPGDLRINDESYPTGTDLEGELVFTWVDRDRRQQTGGEVVDHFDSSPIGPEAGTTYRLRAFKDDDEDPEYEADPATSPLAWTPEKTALYTVLVDALRGGRYSYRPARHVFNYVASAPEITNTLPQPILGEEYYAQLTAVGGAVPYTWSISSGALWSGITLDPDTGEFTGEVPDLTPATFTVRVTASGGTFYSELAFVDFAPRLPDAFAAQVVLLMHLDGNNIDVKGHTFTDVGTVGYAAGKFGNALTLATGDSGLSSAISQADFAFGTSDFTIEGWIKLASGFAGGAMISQFDVGATPGWQIYVTNLGVPQFYHYVGGGSYPINPTGVDLRDGNWHHIAVSRSGTTLRMFVDGVMPTGGSVTNSANYGSSGLYLSIGYQRQGSARYPFRGGIDDVRLTKAARYTANFTPPAGPFPNPS